MSLGFFTWFHDINDAEFLPIVLQADADEVTVACDDADWYICNIHNPANLKIPFIIKRYSVWTLVPASRVVQGGTVVGYARSVLGVATLRCFATSPLAGARTSLIEF